MEEQRYKTYDDEPEKHGFVTLLGQVLPQTGVTWGMFPPTNPAVTFLTGG